MNSPKSLNKCNTLICPREAALWLWELPGSLGHCMDAFKVLANDKRLFTALFCLGAAAAAIQGLCLYSSSCCQWINGTLSCAWSALFWGQFGQMAVFNGYADLAQSLKQGSGLVSAKSIQLLAICCVAGIGWQTCSLHCCSSLWHTILVL